MKKNFFSSAVFLSVGGLICKFMGAIYKILLSNILGAEGIGIYQLVYPLYAFLLVFVSGGIPHALSCFVAKARAQGRTEKISRYFYCAFLYSFALGIAFLMLMICFSKLFSKLQGNPMAWQTYIGFGCAILFSCLLPTFRGLFQGYENYVPTFVSQIAEQLFKLVLGLMFSFLFAKKSLQLGVFGASLGVVAGEFVAFLYLFFCFLNVKKKYKFVPALNKDDSKKFFQYYFGIMLVAIVTPFLNLYQSFVTIPILEDLGFAKKFSTSVYGIQAGMVNSIVNFPMVFSSSLAIVLMPNISFLYEKDRQKAKDVFKQSLKCVLVLSIPCMIGLYILAVPVLNILFPSLDENMMIVAQNFLKISCFEIFFMVVSQVCTIALQGAFLQWKVFKQTLIFAGVYIVALPIMLALFDIYAISLCAVFCYAILAILNIYLAKKTYGIKMEAKVLIIPFVASIFMGILTKFIFDFLQNYSVIFALIFSVIIAVLFYFLINILFGIISKKEILFFVRKNTK